MEQLIPDAGLVVLEGGTHFAFLEQAQRFATIVTHFLSEKTEGEASPADDPDQGEVREEIMTIWSLILLLAITGSCVLAARPLIHFFQLESYQFQGYFRTPRRNLLRAILPGCILNLVFWVFGVALVLVIPETNTWLPGLLLSLILLAAGVILHLRGRKQKAKKALVITPG